MKTITKIKDDVINNRRLSKKDAMDLINFPPEELFKAADEIRQHFCGNVFDACTIINVKSGKCGEDCKFCAQSIHYNTDIDEYSLLSKEKLEKKSNELYESGFKRISYVSSGKSVSKEELEIINEVIYDLCREYDDLKICVSLGLMGKDEIKSLEEHGVDRLHNNLETSEEFFPKICTTHSYTEKLETISTINNKNVLLCSGGIFGLGESYGDRINLAFKLRELNVKSIPINILNPIKNTPLENNEILSNEEVCRIIALFRFINPRSFIRLAGGRLLLEDYGYQAFKSGANAAILGNMLTTRGVTFIEDLQMIEELGYELKYSTI